MYERLEDINRYSNYDESDIAGSAMIEHISKQGRLTIDNAGEMRHCLAEAIRSQSSNDVNVDMSSITYMDTAGLATILEALRIAQKQGKGLVLKGIQEQPRRLFEATELDHIFGMEEVGNP